MERYRPNLENFSEDTAIETETTPHIIDCSQPPDWNRTSSDGRDWERITLHDARLGEFKFDPKDIKLMTLRELLPELEGKRDYEVDGREILRKLHNLSDRAVLPGNVLDYLLDHKELISEMVPEDFTHDINPHEHASRDIAFWGTGLKVGRTVTYTGWFGDSDKLETSESVRSLRWYPKPGYDSWEGVMIHDAGWQSYVELLSSPNLDKTLIPVVSLPVK